MPYFFSTGSAASVLQPFLSVRIGHDATPKFGARSANKQCISPFPPLECSSSSGQVHGRCLPRCMRRRRRSGGVFIIYGACTICQIAIVAAHICQARKKYPNSCKKYFLEIHAKSILALSSVFQGTEKSPPPERQLKNYLHNNSKRLIVLTLLSPVPFSLVPCLPLYAGEYLQQPHYGC